MRLRQKLKRLRLSGWKSTRKGQRDLKRSSLVTFK
jgi:hypothetical protein